VDFDNPAVWLIGGLILLGIIAAWIVPRFSSEARLERRRRKSNARIVSKSSKPMVKFSVRTKNKK